MPHIFWHALTFVPKTCVRKCCKANEWSKLVALLSNWANYIDTKSLKCADSADIFTYMVLIQEKLCNKANECVQLLALLSNSAKYIDTKSFKCADGAHIFTYMVLIQEKLCIKVN